jgi:triosephosphate isomerase
MWFWHMSQYGLLEPVKLLLRTSTKMHKFIRETVRRHTETISHIHPLRRKCEARKRKRNFSKPDVDGGLIGGAALKSDDFVAIVNAI